MSGKQMSGDLRDEPTVALDQSSAPVKVQVIMEKANEAFKPHMFTRGGKVLPLQQGMWFGRLTA